jgi:murein DD-endopeptidase MepM/ murein hydrolase activator NlpD
MLRGLIIFVSVFIFPAQLHSQSFVFLKNYFRWPLANKPGIVANFGELRSDHWHMGLDIRTDQKENMPVYAAAEGYIARKSIRPFSYGKAIYISHPNGLTTVYGHLNKFFPKLDSFVTAQQYKLQSWEIELDFTKDKFPVRKGQFIAYSGNTGASQGPHVHFEIRNTKTERCINPLFFNLPVPDAVPPVFTKLALYNRILSVYNQNPILFSVKKTREGYILLRDTLIKTGFAKISFAIGAYDCVSGSTNPNGIYNARIFFDSQPLIEFTLDSMDYNETDYVNAHIDYRYRYNSGSYLQQLFKLPGDKGRAYRLKNNDGTIQLNDTNVHSVKIEIADVQRNTSIMNFKVQFSDSLASLINYDPHKSFAPNEVNIFEQNDFEVYLKENCLYDSIQPVFYKVNQPAANAISSLFQFCDASVPVHDEINIRIKPNVTIPEEWKNKIVIKRTDGRATNYRKAAWQKDWLTANFNDFGAYQALIDNTPPTINELGVADTIDLSPSKNIVFYPKDNTIIKSFRAELDGQWLMFSNDKGSSWIYNFDERCPYGVHHLKIRIEDIVGNVTEKEWLFKRYPYTPPKKKALKKKSNRKTQTSKKKNIIKKRK